jgi:glucose-1-phosphate adenylyltransferase
MKETKNALVLLLAGGIGSRLNILVDHRAKPAVPFGGLYRIIDFPLSNVMNAGLTRVGVLTQYKPLSLMRHIQAGQAWDFTGRTRCVEILPPRTGEKDSDWYKGTADAIRQNIDFIQANPSEEVVILAGDHIYRMDLDEMLTYHRQKQAGVTVAMMVVPKSEIHQFGAGIVDDNNRIVDWEEKPKEAKTNLASMGIYVFDTQYLLDMLAHDRKEIDFGMHIIPRAIAEQQVFAYPFYGYWRDVGTVQAYWDANMDIIRLNSGISPEEWGIRPNIEADGRSMDRVPARFAQGSRVQSSMICAGCVIEGTVINSILSPGVVVEKGAVVRDSVILQDSIIRAEAQVDLVVCDKRVEVGRRTVLGYGTEEEKKIPNQVHPSHLYSGITLVGKAAKISEGMRIGRNCIVHPGYCCQDGVPPKDLGHGAVFSPL